MNRINSSLKKRLELSKEALKKTVDYSTFDFETTEEVPALTGIVGQERGREAMSFGLKVNRRGYNIYVSGISGTGKTNYTNSIVREFASTEIELFDWCYVYNFIDNAKPMLLKVPVGFGKRLKKDMNEFINQLKNDIPRAFNEESYHKERSLIIREFKEKSKKAFEKFSDLAKDYGFFVRQSSSGIVTIPIMNNQPISEEDYKNLDSEQLKKIEENTNILQEKVLEFTNDMRKMEKVVQEELDNLDSKVASVPVDYLMKELTERYQAVPVILNYLKEVEIDILENTDEFRRDEEDDDNPFGNLVAKKKDSTIKYNVNLLIDNSETKGAPVVTADNPTYYNLIGKVEYESKMGVLSTDFMKIKAGYLHQANGGYIILQAKDVLSNSYAWDALKRALINQKLLIENIGEQVGMVSTTSIKPEPVPLDIKIIIIGSPDIYQLLYHYDEDFRKLFKIRADFDVEMDNNTMNINRFASFIRTRCKEEGLKNFDKTAVAKMVEHSIRIAGNQNKLSTRFNQIVEIIYEADSWADIMGSFVVSAEHIQKAIENKKYRSNLYEGKIQEGIETGDILIDISGYKIGQVNGLAVYQTGQYSFGKPSRITANTYVGQSGIINIERESKMSGNIHSKGVYILSGYLGDKFAQEQPLALSAQLAFEQSYGGVDGDSASSTELYALLSSLADIPINQGLAVTGSINQKGEIQPIGGVNEKIEGYFDVCKAKGLTGEQGVLIPHQNVKNLMLKDEVIEAVEDGMFHIYQVKTVEEGIELLTGLPACRRDGTIDNEQKTVYEKVTKKLANFNKIALNRKEGELDKDKPALK
ncbi:Lon protease family protein [Oceanobacillus halophilus]|uniref:endopeptidase La n=1 Tax=Oceanobacillus halophilus TaxID=930130 RepID=A0A494ZZY2_9BACI|nr:ATP-binding protein [Oceanobacillus halophilus]RKQ32301.1 ATP-dependent protease [Oceanobacillus halophilus]